ncbi:MAG: hypothetical protein QM689_06615 [Oscillospiraceae bacterium]
MLGTGTQADPYQVTTIAEFRAINSSASYYKLMNDIDAAAYNNGSWTPATLAAKEIDGDGFALMNIYFNYVSTMTNSACIYITSAMTVKNLSIRNLLCVPFASGSSPLLFASTNTLAVTAVNCDFQIRISDPNNYTKAIFRPENVALDTCTISLETHSAKPIPIDFLTAVNTNFYLDVSGLTYNTGFLLMNTVTTTQAAHYMNACSIRGKITAAANAVPNGSIAALYLASNIGLSYFAVEVANIPAISFTGTNVANTATAVVFYDRELAPATTFSATPSTNCFGLTTAQCKSKTYLNGIGFPVV